MHNRTPRKSAEQWAQIIADFDQSGLSTSDYCKEHRLVPATFGKWKRRFSTISVPVIPTPSFVQIQRTEPMARKSSCVTVQIGPSITLAISLDGAVHE